MLAGEGRRRYWPVGPGCYTEDDFRVDPRLGLAIVARGSGAIGGQGKPAGKLAVWSIAGEVGAVPAETGLRGGFERAQAAVERLTGSWAAGLIRPMATAAALLVDGATAVVGQIGDCRVTRVRSDGLETLTRAHTLGAMWPDQALAPSIARVVTRGLGVGGEPEFRRIAVRPGDVFLLAAPELAAALTEAELATLLRPLCEPGGAIAAVADAVVDAVLRGGADWGKLTFAVVRVGDGGGAVSCGSRQPPRPRWLFAPGEPLAEVPEPWTAAGDGPDRRWFDEVLAAVMGDDD
jgi:serine/threonine protein phosphatase PrpC